MKCLKRQLVNDPEKETSDQLYRLENREAAVAAYIRVRQGVAGAVQPSERAIIELLFKAYRVHNRRLP